MWTAATRSSDRQIKNLGNAVAGGDGSRGKVMMLTGSRERLLARRLVLISLTVPVGYQSIDKARSESHGLTCVFCRAQDSYHLITEET